MIKISRTYDVKSIPAGFRGAKRIAKQRLLLDMIHSGTAPFDLTFNSNVWKPAKKALKNETGGKCAYCEAPAAGRSKTAAKGGLVAHCDVEHFRPKNTYWWLAHNFENYLLSCQVCNQSFKSDQFPAMQPLGEPFVITGSESSVDLDGFADVMAPDPLDIPGRSKWEQALLAEDADLADPLHEDPEELFAYKADEVLKEVSIKPKASSGRRKARAVSSIEILGLEREELRFARYDVYHTVSVLNRVLDDAGVSVDTRSMVEDELARLMSWKLPFAGMVRFFVNGNWGRGILPADD